MDVKLVVIKGSQKTREVLLRKAETVIGRQIGCGLRIPSATVSRRHCRLFVCDDALAVEDLGSVNGTFLNGRRVRGSEPVRPGDRLEIGPVAFIVEYQPPPAAPLQTFEPPVQAPLPTAEVLPMVMPIEDESWVEAIPLEEEPAPPPKADVAPTVRKPAADESPPVSLPFDADDEWRLPAGADLRDILSQMEED
jgi:predicted component of type VI protein secretion system